jgi:hypothetical protein
MQDLVEGIEQLDAPHAVDTQLTLTSFLLGAASKLRGS